MSYGKLFQKNKENFICEKCGQNVIGNGFTNHCPNCLWSKHVDINPGDRGENCGGLMIPVGILKKKGDYYINHQCQKCGFERSKKMEPNDNFDQIVSVSKK
jgi:ribosomal protein L37E